MSKSSRRRSLLGLKRTNPVTPRLPIPNPQSLLGFPLLDNLRTAPA
jgi:hypothetical protein